MHNITETSSNSLEKKAVIIGLDGVPCSLIKYYMEEGIMPHFKEMVAAGSLMPMKSSLPEVSSVAWTSFMTGHNPGQHGIFGFMELDNNNYGYHFPNYLSVKSPTFWEELDVPTIAINIPQTYPAKAIKGALVSGFIALELEKAVYPWRIYEFLSSIDYQLDVNSNLAITDPEAFFQNLFKVLATRIAAIKYLYSAEEWRIFIGTITETDRLHHFFFDSACGGKHFDIFAEIYKKIDDFLWEIYLRAEKDNAIFLTCSDHGFSTITTEVYINQYLKENGFLRIKGDKGFRGITADSRAFSLEPARIYVHRQNKYPRGNVSDSEYESLRQELKTIFEALVFNGKKVVKKVFLKEEIFSGPCADEAPDLYVLAEPGFDIKATLKKNTIFGRSQFTGAHTYHNAHLYLSNNVSANLPVDASIGDISSIIKNHFTNGQAY
ncbi:MAG: alkaline phosphatase family protein [Syntrophales bacterium]|nr:alkaline phosphatase family protein [Syntrophales bacterium]